MKREDFAKKIRWSWIIWIAGIVNVSAMLPQLYRLIKTHETDGLSLGMFWIYFVIQVAFALEGYFKKNKMFMVCLGLSAVVSATIIGLVIYFRQISL